MHSDGLDGVGIMQEIPEYFTAKTGWPGVADCALVTSISTLKEWPLQIRRLHNMRAGVAAVSVGGGWAKFIEDQKLGVGAFLTFEVVDKRRLVVALHNRRSADEPHQPQALHADTLLVRDLLECDPPDAGESQHTVTQVLSEANGHERPQFRKTLRKTHTLKNESSRLVSAHPLLTSWWSLICEHSGWSIWR